MESRGPESWPAALGDQDTGRRRRGTAGGPRKAQQEELSAPEILKLLHLVSDTAGTGRDFSVQLRIIADSVKSALLS